MGVQLPKPSFGLPDAFCYWIIITQRWIWFFFAFFYLTFFIQFQFRVMCILLQFWVNWYIIKNFLYHQKFSKNSKTHITLSSNRKFKIGTHFYQIFLENILKQNLNMPDITQSIYLLKCEWIYSTIRINRYFKT